jgi:hypothetical protein
MAEEMDSTNQLLRVIIALLMENSETLPKLRQRVDFLNKAGLKNSEIAKILGKTNTYVAKELNSLRASRK